MYSKGLAPLAAASVVTITTALALVFFYAHNDADQGFVQKIFYIHVPMAIVALCGFVAGGVFAIRHLRSGDRSWDMRSYVAIHLSIILGLAVLIACAQATEPLFRQQAGPEDLARWLSLLTLYDVVFVLLSVAVFDFLLED